MKEEISYRELSRRVGDSVLANSLRMELLENYNFELFSGEDTYCYKHETEKECEEKIDQCDYESKDIYQEYIITESGADYLKRNTNEIVFYCSDLDLYLWGITHFGTSWDGVFTTLTTKTNE